MVVVVVEEVLTPSRLFSSLQRHKQVVFLSSSSPSLLLFFAVHS